MEAAPCKVLVVDDEQVIADSLKLIFLKEGYQAHAAYSAEQATEIMAAWMPDLMVIDVILPGMNGIELALVVREQFPNCRVLLFSGQSTTGSLLTGAASSGHSFTVMAKPVHPEEMLAAARRLLTPDWPSQDAKPSGDAAGAEPVGPGAAEATGPSTE